MNPRVHEMTESQSRAATSGKRRWYQSIAAKLLTAFGLIAALTVGASWLSLIRFNEVDSVMRRMTEVSLPLAKLSLGIESNTTALVAAAADLAGADTETEQTERMAKVTEQIVQLWVLLGNLQAIIVEKTALTRLQEVVSALDTALGAIDRATREFVETSTLRRHAIEQVAWANEAVLRPLGPLTEQLNARVAAIVDRSDASAIDQDELRNNLALLRALNAVRAHVNRITDLDNRVVTAQNGSLQQLGQQLAANHDELQQDLTAIDKAPQVDADRRTELRTAIAALISSGTGERGPPSQQALYIPQRQAVADSQKALETVSTDLRNHVAKPVQDP